MLRAKSRCERPRRRGAVVVLAAVILSVMVGLLAFAVDIGYIELSRTQLQAAADSSALAGAASVNLPRADMETVAKRFADANMVAGRKVQLQSRDIEYGTWDAGARTFTPSPSPSNAVRVTVRTDDDTGGKTKLFFARIFNVDSLRQWASAVATVNPRDICFVVDLSGSMHDDTDPDNTAEINSTFASQGYPNIGSDLLNQLYADFGFNCTYPNEPSQWIGKPLGVSSSGDPLNTMTKNGGVLTQSSIPSKYRIKTSDSTSVRKQKAYSWTMDKQLAAAMPAAKPVPNSATNYAYWAAFLDDYYRRIGYRSYVNFMIYHGRDLKPDGATYTPLSQFSPDCPWHAESTAGGTFNFPPREQPTHASRRAIIAAIDLIKDRNENVSDNEQRDWVSIVTFDKITGGGPKVLVPLTGDYDAAMQACPRLQACGSDTISTATETGLMMAYNHIKPESKGGQGREATNKIVVLLTDGAPNLYSSSSSTIRNYIQDNPSSNFYGNKNAHDAALMQTSIMQGDRWSLYPVGIGLATDYAFMDRMGRMGATANKDGQSPRGSGNPADYEDRLREIFENIITNPKLRLVQ